MRTRVRFAAFAMAAAFVLLHGAEGFGQGLDQEGSAQETSSPPSARAPQRHVPVFGGADEFALAGGAEYYTPQPGFDRENRDIDVQLARIAAAAHLPQGWELQFGALLFRAHGTRTEASLAASPPQVASNAAGVGAGPLVRWNFLQFSHCRLFLDAEGDLLLADRPFPEHGSSYDFFLHTGGGISVWMSDTYWLESAFHFSHISNGQGFGPGNPTWQGNAVLIGVRRNFRRDPESRGKPWLASLFGSADENAWITSVEDFTPLAGLNREVPNFQGDLRVLRISRAWHFPQGFEFQLGASVQKTDATFGFGPLVRWNAFEATRWRLFVDGGAELLQSGSPAFIIPWPGDGYTGLLRAGGGGSVRLRGSYWLETTFRWAHVPTGIGPGADGYPRWSGQGISISLRHTFRRGFVE
jgi:hypothetical protein